MDESVSSLTLALPPAGAAPEWVHVLPAGTFSGVDGRGPYKLTAAQPVIDASLQHGAIPFDENHSTESAAIVGGEAPARGWIDKMEMRQDGIWAHVDWTKAGRAIMEDKSYRFVSPVFNHTKDGVVTDIKSVALTNNPNLIEHLKAMQTPLSAEARRAIKPRLFAVPGKEKLPLENVSHVEDAWREVNYTQGLTEAERAEARRRILARAKELGVDTSGWSAHTSQEGHMEKKAICTALGIPEAAEDAAVLVALQTAAGAQTELQTAKARVATLEGELAAAKTGTVSMTQYNDLQAKVANMELDGKKAAAVAFVDNAIKEGKPIADGVRDTYVSMHVANPAEAEALIKALPSLNAAGPGTGTRRAKQSGGDDADAVEAMSAEDKAVCAKMNLTPEKFIAMRKKMREKA